MVGRDNDRYVRFLEEVSDRASPSIRKRFRRLRPCEQTRVRRLSDHVLRDPVLRKKQKLRDGAARLNVALLPKTFPSIKRLLGDSKLAHWYDVHFIIFASLDRKDFGKTDQLRILKSNRNVPHVGKEQCGFRGMESGLSPG